MENNIAVASGDFPPGFNHAGEACWQNAERRMKAGTGGYFINCFGDIAGI